MATPMPALTIWQPWATFIFLALKTIETRTHDRYRGLVGKRIAIHAGRTWDGSAMNRARHALRAQTRAMPAGVETLARAQAGHVICTVKVAAHKRCRASDRDVALCECEGLYGLVLDELRTLDHAIPAKGKQGVWAFGSRTA